jgi:hypothetical protein
MDRPSLGHNLKSAYLISTKIITIYGINVVLFFLEIGSSAQAEL